MPDHRGGVGSGLGLGEALLLPYLNDALRMYESRYASREDIDAAMRFGCGHPRGPLQVLDELGLDVALGALRELHGRSGNPLHAPADLLSHLVSVGWTGAAAGRGVYSYDGEGRTVDDELTRTAATAVAASRPVSRVGVVGSGTMACGIVEVCARAGYEVVVLARSEGRVGAVREAVDVALKRAARRGRLEPDEQRRTAARVTGTTRVGDLGGCELVVEAVVEDLAVKQALFAELDRACPAGAVLTTTTSSLPVAAIAAATARPEAVAGMHWFNPVPVMRLVEVVPTDVTAADVTATVLQVCATAGKHAVVCGDRPGFIVNALLFPFLNSAVRAFEGGAGSMDEIDDAVRSAAGFPLGPFALLDVVGLDVALAIQQTLQAASGEPGHAPAAKLAELVSVGALGRKTGRGMRTH